MTDNNGEVKSERIEISLKQQEQKEILIFKDKISINPHFTLEQKIELISEYTDGLFRTGFDFAHRFEVAEYALYSHILEMCTNVDVENIDVNLMVSTGFWDEVSRHIEDYVDLRKDIDKVIGYVQYEKTIEKSLGNAIEKLVENAISAINRIPEMNVDELRKVSKEFTDRLNELNSNVPGIVGGNNNGATDNGKVIKDDVKQGEKTSSKRKYTRKNTTK